MNGLAIFSWHRPLRSFEKMLDPKMAVVFGGNLGAITWMATTMQSKKQSAVPVQN